MLAVKVVYDKMHVFLLSIISCLSSFGQIFCSENELGRSSYLSPTLASMNIGKCHFLTHTINFKRRLKLLVEEKKSFRINVVGGQTERPLCSCYRHNSIRSLDNKATPIPRPLNIKYINSHNLCMARSTYLFLGIFFILSTQK